MDAAFRDDLARRLPIPLAQLYRRAHTADSAIERHHAAYYLFEATLKLLGSAAVAEVQARPERLAEYEELLARLARPSIGDWREIVERLVPELAKTGDAGFQAVAEVLFGKPRSDFPALSRLDALLREAVEGKASNRTNVRPMDVLALLVRYRNQEIGHGATGLRPASHYARHGVAILQGVLELLERVDPLAGRRLWYISAISRTAAGAHRVDRLDLHGENATRLPVLELPEIESVALPRPGQACLAPTAEMPPAELLGRLCSLHPLLVYDAETREPFLLNAQRGKAKVELLCYTSGEISHRDDLAPAQMKFLQAALHRPVESGEVAAWQAQSVTGDAPPPAAIGEPLRKVGEYELVSRIGHGGMGIVYRAWQPLLGRQVAVKCLMRAGDPKAQSRFLREVRALGRVRHPNLVQIHSSGCDGEVWFYAMDLIPGADLATVCEKLSGQEVSRLDTVAWKSAVTTACETTRQREHKLAAQFPEGLTLDSSAETAVTPLAGETASPQPAAPAYVAQAASLIRQAADAVEALHEAGIIHRDLKPGNIMVSPDGSRATLMDLGLAQIAETNADKLTKTRQFVGTLRYASPEQVLAADKVDRRSDVYSLGATLWELLTLRMLFGADDTTPTPKLMNQVAFKPPGSPRAINPAVPPALEAIVLKCLAKDPDDRYATAGALRDDLVRYLSGRPVMAEQEQKTRHSKRLLLYTACSAAAVLLAFATVLTLARFGGETPTAQITNGGKAAEAINPILDTPNASGSPFIDKTASPPAKASASNPFSGQHLRGGAAAPAPAGVRRALLIGANYRNSERQLQFAVADMFELAKVLQQGGYAEVVLCTDEGGRRPTRETIMSEVGRLADDCVPGDMLLVAYSGHVHQDEEGRPYIVPADGDKSDPVGTGLPFSDIVECLEKSAASSKIFISDFCTPDRPAESGPAPQIKVDSESVSIILSAGAGEVALEHASLGHGIFYYHLLAGLCGAANADGDTEIDTAELFKYVKAATTASARELFQRQETPQQFGRIRPVSLIADYPNAAMVAPQAQPVEKAGVAATDTNDVMDKDATTTEVAKRLADWAAQKLRDAEQDEVMVRKKFALDGSAVNGLVWSVGRALEAQDIRISEQARHVLSLDLEFFDGVARLSAAISDESGVTLHQTEVAAHPQAVALWLGSTFEIWPDANPTERQQLFESADLYLNERRLATSRESTFCLSIQNPDPFAQDESKLPVVNVNAGQALVQLPPPMDFAVLIENSAGFDIGVQLAYDGINVLTLKGSPELSETGFIFVPAHGKILIYGWFLEQQEDEQFFGIDKLPKSFPEWVKPDPQKCRISAIFRAVWELGSPPPWDEPPSRAAAITGHGVNQTLNTVRREYGVVRGGVTVLLQPSSTR